MNVVEFEAGALRSLRRRCADLGAENESLAAYVEGASGAVEAVQLAALAMTEVSDLGGAIRAVTHELPCILSLDAAAIALSAAGVGYRAGPSGIARVPASNIAAWSGGARSAFVRRAVGGTHLFGEAGARIRVEAILPILLPRPLGSGLIALGSARDLSPPPRGGEVLLDFLAGVASRMIARCLKMPPSPPSA